MPSRLAGAWKSATATSIALACLLFAGCAAYQMGDPSDPGFSTVFVPVVTNDTFLPQSRAAVTTAVREALVRDGRVNLAKDPQSADRVIEVRLSDYSRAIATALPQDTALARKFVLTLSADVTIVDPASPTAQQRTYKVSVSMDSFTDSGELQSEFQAVPLLAEKLANEITHRVLDTW